jgi:hypothetical protein
MASPNVGNIGKKRNGTIIDADLQRDAHMSVGRMGSKMYWISLASYLATTMGTSGAAPRRVARTPRGPSAPRGAKPVLHGVENILRGDRAPLSAESVTLRVAHVPSDVGTLHAHLRECIQRHGVKRPCLSCVVRDCLFQETTGEKRGLGPAPRIPSENAGKVPATALKEDECLLGVREEVRLVDAVNPSHLRASRRVGGLRTRHTLMI